MIRQTIGLISQQIQFSIQMKKTEFDFKKHQNFSKSWKMLIRFLIYSIVIAVLLFLIFYRDNSVENQIKEAEIKQIDLEMENIEVK